MRTYLVKFAYSGRNKREFMTQEFKALSAADVENKIEKYLKEQNSGEPKSDRIRYWSMKEIKTPTVK